MFPSLNTGKWRFIVERVPLPVFLNRQENNYAYQKIRSSNRSRIVDDPPRLYYSQCAGDTERNGNSNATEDVGPNGRAIPDGTSTDQWTLD